MNEKQGFGLVITGISGGGKTSVAEAIIKRHPRLFQGLRLTVRDPRPGELHLVHYEFVTPQEMDRLNAANELLYHEDWYGSLYAMRRRIVEERLQNGEDVLIETIVPAALKLHKRPDMRVVFLVTPDEQTEVQRLRDRGEKDNKIQERLDYARREREMAKEIGVFTVVNDNFNETVNVVDEFLFRSNN
jgi:guanylate kinase